MQKDTVRIWLNVVGTVATLLMNGLANALPFNNLTTGEISDSFEVYFVPAGYVFSIWGVIYLFLIAFTVYQALPAQRENPRLRRIGYAYLVSCAANSVWLLFWHYQQFWLTLVTMLILLGSLIFIYLRLGIGQTATARLERWTVDTTFSVYLGWITVATVANGTSLLDYLGWGGWGIAPAVWAVIMLVVATGVALAMSLTRGDVAYIAVIVWAFIGIAVSQADTAIVAASAVVLAALAAVSLFYSVPQQRARLARS